MPEGDPANRAFPEDSVLVRELRTPRSAAIAGIVFALTLGTVIVLMRSSGPAGLAGEDGTLMSADRRRAVSISLNLIPFAGIAFLWFIGVVRSRLGAQEDKLFATVFLGSGLLFVAMLFAGSGVLGGLLVLEGQPKPISTDMVRLAQVIAGTLIGTFGARMAGVFVMAVSTVGRRSGVVPRWLCLSGYAVALVLLLSPPLTGWSQLLFPGWVLALSVHALVVGPRPTPTPGTLPST